MRVALVFVFGLAAVMAAHEYDPIDLEVNPKGSRIVGGSYTTITAYPFGAALLADLNAVNHRHSCGGSIINNQVILTAANCFHLIRNANQWRTRVGSHYAHSGGILYNTNYILRHPWYNSTTQDNDVALIRIIGNFVFTNYVRAASIAGANYNLLDNQVVWAIGWGSTGNAQASEQLRHVQVWTINQAICNQRYGGRITLNMVCSGWLDVGGRDQCQGDSGGPLLHNNIVVGITSWGYGCGSAIYPGVNTRVSAVSTWIQQNASAREYDPIDLEVNPKGSRIVGGSYTNITAYPFGAALLAGVNAVNYRQSCGGTILNVQVVLTAAHCLHLITNANQWRTRVGSHYANSGGIVYDINYILRHPGYNSANEDNDVALLRIIGNFVYTNYVRAASIAGANYNLLDNQVVWAIGWGRTYENGPASDQLRHVQMWTINQVVCYYRYGRRVTRNMVCSGWGDDGGHDQCLGDSGGPLLRNNIVVGITSWGYGCASPIYPGVNTRVSAVSTWIRENA